MTRTIIALAFATLINASAFADVTPAPVHTHSYTRSDAEFDASFGLGAVNSKFHLGVGLEGKVPVKFDGNDFKFGGRTGIYFGPSNPTDFIIPVLGTAEYDFRVDNALKPYFGFDLGLTITHSSYFDGQTNVDFAFLFVPGVNFTDNGNYFFEVPLGSFASSFVILPSIGVRF